MSLSKQLSRWRGAGLIDQDAQARILEFEAKRSRPRLVYGLAALGAVSIGIGIISIVAANWDGIGPYTKLSVDLLLAAGLAAGIYRAVVQRAALRTEVLGMVYYLFTLASLALVGQVYQLSTAAWQALAVWSAVTLPLVLLLESYLAGMVWFIGLGTSFVMAVSELMDLIDDPQLRGNLGIALLSAWPLLVMLLARFPWRREARRRFIRSVDFGAWTTLVLSGVLSPFILYGNISSRETLDWGLLFCAGTVLGLHFCHQRWLSAAPKRARLSLSASLAYTWLTVALGAGLTHGELNVVGALLQLGYLGLLAFISLQFGWVRTFHALTGIIAIRLSIVYFEVFGSMLSTGLGLVSGGVLTLLLAWLWKRKSPQLAARFERGAGASHAA